MGDREYGYDRLQRALTPLEAQERRVRDLANHLAVEQAKLDVLRDPWKGLRNGEARVVDNAVHVVSFDTRYTFQVVR